MSTDTTPITPQSTSPVETKVPLEPAIPAPGAEEKHEKIDKAIENVDHKSANSY